VHVWTGRRADEVSDSDRLLSDVLHDHLPPGEVDTVERQILHDDDPARALAGLSREGLLLVVAAVGEVGSTVRRLAGRTWCPLAVVLVAPVSVERW
jgi:hypothetical protein